MKKIFVSILLLVVSAVGFAQNTPSENLVIITFDGLRWQEIFKGIDSSLIANKNFTKDSSYLVKKFWSNDEKERRKKLFPFIWTVIEQKGQLYGNRSYNSMVNNANPYWFSYPGYNEIFTGYPDTAVNSNDKIPNKNENVLEFINAQKNYKNKVAAFSSWDCFPYILNKWRSGLYVNSDVDTLAFSHPQLQLVNDMQFLAPQPVNLRPDVITYFAAREYLKAYKPKVLYIAFDETDDFAHEGSYDMYIKTAHAEDAMVRDLWTILQSMPEYRNKTTLVLTCDHGRGDSVKTQWTSHGSDIKGANEIWMAFMGPQIKTTGEIAHPSILYQAQLAATFAQLLGFHFQPAHPVMQPIDLIWK